jgi:type II secretory pathway pseudopilin PulG
MKPQHGITLIEMTIILAIVGLLIASLLIPFATQMEIAKIHQTEKTLEQVKQALIDYATLNDRLPCPATLAETGMEDQASCENEGFLPWANLGLGRDDAWGNPLRYGVSQHYTKSGKSPNTIIVQDTQGNHPVTGITAVIFSYGKNGKPDQPNSSFSTGFSLENWLFPTAFADNFDDMESRTGGNNQIYSQGSIVPNGKYDDILVFLPKTTLVSANQQLQPLEPSLVTQQPEDEEEYKYDDTSTTTPDNNSKPDNNSEPDNNPENDSNFGNNRSINDS